MSGGLLALLDDVAVIAKLAAAKLDDVVVQSAKVGGKVAGIVIDDAAVTPRYVVGFAAEREIPIIRKIAVGSLKNKLLYLLPAALALSVFAPWAITPLLMVGGLFLCFEGYEKVHAMVAGGHVVPDPSEVSTTAVDPAGLENEKVAGAIRTDMILSAEIMAISLAAVVEPNIALKAFILAAVAIAVTVAVYGAVALIVKADDVGAAMALTGNAAVRAIGRALVFGMPTFLAALSLVGTLAMLWVGGGIVIHGLAEYGLGAVEHTIMGIGKAVGRPLGAGAGAVGWFVAASLAGLIGLVLGALVALAVGVVQRLRGVPAH